MEDRDEGATTVALIRHGESQAQVAGLIAGHDGCRGLTDRGRRQAEALRDRLARLPDLRPVDAVYTSRIGRAIETAAIIAPALRADGEAATVAECDWCELHLGPAEGLTWSQLRLRHPPAGDPDDPYRPRVPGAEAWSAFYDRVGAAMARLVRDHAGGRVAVVAHAGTIGAALVALGPVPLHRGVEVIRSIRNTSITAWRHAGGSWDLVRFDDARHLDDLA